MLKTLRENFKHLQWILWAVIAIFVVFVFVDWGMGSTPTAKGETNVVAKAGDIRITTGEFQRAYRNMEDRYRQMYGKSFSPELLKAMNLPQQVLEQLIDERILRKEAEKMHLAVTDTEVSNYVLGLKDDSGHPVFLKDGAFIGDKIYRSRLASIGQTPENFELGVKQQLLIQKLHRLVTESTFVSVDEVKSEYESRNVKAKIAFVMQPVGVGAAPQVTDAEAQKYFDENKTLYTQPERRSAAYLLVEKSKVMASIVVPEKDIEAEYNANLESYRRKEEVHARHILYRSEGTPDKDAAAKAKADVAVKKLKAGADFGELAKAESDDPGSKGNGGDLGAFSRGRMVKEFEEAAFSAEPKVIVGPVKTSYGYHVIQVLEKTPERTQPLFEVSAGIRARLQDKQAGEKARQIARGLYDQLKKIGKPSDDEMRRLTGPNVSFRQTIAPLTKGGSEDPSLGTNPAVSQALFALKEGEVAEPVSIETGDAVVKLTEIKKPGLPTFLEVKSKVIGDLAKKKQDDAASDALRTAMAGGASLEDVAAKLNLKVETPAEFSRSGPIAGLGPSKPVADAAFAANAGETKGPVAIPGRGAVVFRLLEKTAFDQAKFDAEKDKIKETLKNQKSGKLMSSLIAQRRANLKIETNPEILASYSGGKS